MLLEDNNSLLYSDIGNLLFVKELVSSVSAKSLNERANKLAKEIKVVVVKAEDELD